MAPNNLERQFQGADNTNDASMANADDGADIDEATKPATTEPNPTPEHQQQAAAGQQPATSTVTAKSALDVMIIWIYV